MELATFLNTAATIADTILFPPAFAHAVDQDPV